jgi:hypothetical protein
MAGVALGQNDRRTQQMKTNDKRTTSGILTPADPRWRAFLEFLSADVIREKCRHDHRHAEKILNRMGDVDVPGSVAFFKRHGGYCDCEILFNVENSVGAD